ncbi:MAG: hypothetical protein KAX49_21000 [Halanaerobiales bacterium]|nr:hypothetical protein [Halanaerobiales bacterium]
MIKWLWIDLIEDFVEVLLLLGADCEFYALNVTEVEDVKLKDGVYSEIGIIDVEAKGTKSSAIAFGKTIAEMVGNAREDGDIYY